MSGYIYTINILTYDPGTNRWEVTVSYRLYLLEVGDLFIYLFIYLFILFYLFFFTYLGLNWMLQDKQHLCSDLHLFFQLCLERRHYKHNNTGVRRSSTAFIDISSGPTVREVKYILSISCRKNSNTVLSFTTISIHFSCFSFRTKSIPHCSFANLIKSTNLLESTLPNTNNLWPQPLTLITWCWLANELAIPRSRYMHYSWTFC